MVPEQSRPPLVLCKHGTVGKCRDCLKAEIAGLRAAIEDYRLWEPRKAGHAAAHARLLAALDE